MSPIICTSHHAVLQRTYMASTEGLVAVLIVIRSGSEHGGEATTDPVCALTRDPAWIECSLLEFGTFPAQL